MVLILVVALSVPMFSASVFAADFSDTNGHWAENVIDKWSDAGILNGYPDGTFRPNNYITRGEFFKVINTVLKYEAMPEANPFWDLRETAWYYADIMKLAEAGIVKGSGGQVNAEGNITREEAFAILARAYKVPTNPEGITGFADVASVSSWAAPEVGGMAAAGYVRGSNGAINGKANLTRAEAVQVIDNIAGETLIGDDDTPLAPGTTEGGISTGGGIASGAGIGVPTMPVVPPPLNITVSFTPNPVPAALAGAVQIDADGVFVVSPAALGTISRADFETGMSVTLAPPTGILDSANIHYQVRIEPTITIGDLTTPPGILDRESVTRTMSGADIHAFMTGPKTLRDFYEQAGFGETFRQQVYDALRALQGTGTEFGLTATFSLQTGTSGTVELIRIRVE
jgi:hypothetical protein